MSPDPSRRPIEDSYVTSTFNNTENDNDDISYEGYEILPQDSNEDQAELGGVEFQDSNSEEEDEVCNNAAPSNFDESVKIELTELWCSSNNVGLTAITMDSIKEEEIKNAMASFKLPATSIPTWAKNIPEEQWKQQILNRLNSNRT